MKKLEKVPLTREFLLQRGKCCGSKCVACPYIPKWIKGNKNGKR